MERAKKMVLISTDNLERLQHHQLEHSSSLSSSTTVPSVSMNNGVLGTNGAKTVTEENNENTVRTPGTVLSRLDSEMHRILNSPILGGAREKWRLYGEVLQRYLYFFREREKRRLLRGRNKDDTEEDAAGDAGTGVECNAVSDDDDDDDDDGKGDDTVDNIGNGGNPANDNEREEEEDIPDLETDAQRSPSVSQRRRHDVAGRLRRIDEQRCVGRIINRVPKTYRAKVRKLLTHLCAVAVPARLSWNKQGTVTIDNKVLRGSNIVDLLNNAARERKIVRAVARAQFARLLHDVGTLPEYVGNPLMLDEDALEQESNLSAKLGESLPRGSSTPLPPADLSYPSSKRRIGETSLEEKEDRSRSLFVTSDQNRHKTRVSGDVYNTSGKRRMVDWNPLELSGSTSRPDRSSSLSPLGREQERERARKRTIAETSFSDERGKGRATFIASDKYRHKTRVSDNRE